MIKVRFHLGAGPHKGHWQVRYSDGRVVYHDPAKTTLILWSAKLRNHPAAATKIYCGAHKQVCAWIEAKHVSVCEHSTVADVVCAGLSVSQDQRAGQYHFNPRVAPHWRDGHGGNADNRSFARAVTVGQQVFCYETH